MSTPIAVSPLYTLAHLPPLSTYVRERTQSIRWESQHYNAKEFATLLLDELNEFNYVARDTLKDWKIAVEEAISAAPKVEAVVFVMSMGAPLTPM